MNLIIDIGNTSTKITIGTIAELNHTYILDSITIEFLDNLKKKFPEIKHSIVSNVAELHQDVIQWLKQNYHHIDFNYTTPIPIKNNYTTPETLGLDRLACAVGCGEVFPDKNVLCIDAGTCIKYDFLSAESIFYGGAIAPGLQMRLQALHNFTARLPLIHYKGENIDLIGNSTEKSILSGVINGMIAEITGIISFYKYQFADLKVIITGGDAKYFEKKIKNTIFAQPNLVAIGLNKILNFNIQQ